MRHRLSTGLAVALAALAALLSPLAAAGGDDATSVRVYKSPTCGCCTKWIEHLEANGFAVTATDVPDVDPVKQMNGVPAHLASCHTALVDGYVIEGHVPAADIRRLLATKPKVAGLAVPGMPMGSPGMEGPRSDRYDVVAFGAEGGTETFATHGP
ncbi:MAG: DUF411 domain-containing protein [Myxococcales bacterium]|nr:DUF411 domain-containing protein [Myxococcales bacterium]